MILKVMRLHRSQTHKFLVQTLFTHRERRIDVDIHMRTQDAHLVYPDIKNDENNNILHMKMMKTTTTPAIPITIVQNPPNPVATTSQKRPRDSPHDDTEPCSKIGKQEKDT